MNEDLDRRTAATAHLFLAAAREAGALVTGDGRVSEPVAASLIGHHKDTLRRWREAGEGPPFFKIGGSITYRLRDVAEWVEVSRVIAAVGARGR